MTIRPVLAAALVACALAPAAAALAPADDAVLAVTVRDARGVPVADAVVTVHPRAGAKGQPLRFAWPNRMLQKDIAFQPGTLIVPLGSDVAFPNADKVRHHVYSFSKPARFDLKLYGREETRSHRFAIAGNVALGCNIHDRMKGYIKVVDTPFAAKTDRNGQLRIAGLPAGAASVEVWHPHQRTRDGESAYRLDVPASGTVAKDFAIAMRPL